MSIENLGLIWRRWGREYLFVHVSLVQIVKIVVFQEVWFFPKVLNVINVSLSQRLEIVDSSLILKYTINYHVKTHLS